MKKTFIRIGREFYACKCLYQKYINGFYVPCGKCEFCRKTKSRELAFRLEQEGMYKWVYNVLLTYDEENVPLTDDGTMTLRKQHIVEFMKRFRYYVDEIFGCRLKFFLVGEYGGKFLRPHYHMILFSDNSLEVEDSINGCFAFIHDILESSWKKGFCNIELLRNSGASVRYLVNYLNNTYKEVQGKEKPFRMMTKGNRNSRGLGYCYILNNPDKIKQMIANMDYTYKVKIDGKYKNLPIPRYFKNLIAPEEHRIAMADDFFHYCQNYQFYLTSLTRKEKYEFAKNTKLERKRQKEREFEDYLKNKVHNERNAARVFNIKRASK